MGESVVVSAGNLQGELTLHEPFGAYRGGAPTTAEITDQGFTGHKENRELGLTYMKARFYVAGIGLFVSADSIIPETLNPQSFNRYSYVLNNPLKYTDPSGHCATVDLECWDYLEDDFCNDIDCGPGGWQYWIHVSKSSVWIGDSLRSLQSALKPIPFK